VELVWVNGENFATGKRSDAWRCGDWRGRSIVQWVCGLCVTLVRPSRPRDKDVAVMPTVYDEATIRRAQTGRFSPRAPFDGRS